MVAAENSLKLWLTLQAHGRQAYGESIDRQFELAAFFADSVRTSELFELAVPQVLPIVNFRLKRPGLRKKSAAPPMKRLCMKSCAMAVAGFQPRWSTGNP